MCLLFAFSPLSLGIVLSVAFVYITIRWTDFLFYTMLGLFVAYVMADSPYRLFGAGTLALRKAG